MNLTKEQQAELEKKYPPTLGDKIHLIACETLKGNMDGNIHGMPKFETKLIDLIEKEKIDFAINFDKWRCDKMFADKLTEEERKDLVTEYLTELQTKKEKI